VAVVTDLSAAIAALRAALAAARESSDIRYAERLIIFRQVDDLQEQAELFLCEASDYPDESADDRE
jgi:hypothetical protein